LLPVARREPERDEIDRSSTGSKAGPEPTAHPDPEVVAQAKRRSFTAEYKQRILSETDRAKGSGGVGALLRREGLYSSLLATWRRERAAGVRQALAPQKRGPKSKRDPIQEEIQKLQKDNARLTEQLRKAEIVIDVQKNRRARLNRTPAGPETVGICTLVVPGGMSVHFLVFCEPVKKHGLAMAHGLDSGDAVRRSRLGN
jgi:transposase-like protein